nr:hypothetical protein RAR13_01315 [Aminobacter aminovorans]
MQYPFSCVQNTFDCIEKTLSPARLARYLPAANGDKHLALRLYVWNARLCEAMYLPLQTAEVAVRNAVQIPVGKRFKNQWYTNPKFLNLLPARMKGELEETVRKETKKRGAALTQDHIVANLSFGFWANLMTRAYDKHLWAIGVRQSFPGAGAREDREAIYQMLDQMRSFRNEVMHHYAIFDRGPQAKFQNVLHITKMVCPETHWLSLHLSRVSQIINARPMV